MAYKHQSECFRTIRGVRYVNYADLIYGDAENRAVVAEAKSLYGKVRKIKHRSGDYYQLFVVKH